MHPYHENMYDLTLRHGGGNDVMNIRSLDLPLYWYGYNGNDAMFISSTANVLLDQETNTQVLDGTIDGITDSASMYLHFGNGAHRMFISDRDNITPGYGHPQMLLSNSSITGLFASIVL
jgi:hypothetical protein